MDETQVQTKRQKIISVKGDIITNVNDGVTELAPCSFKMIQETVSLKKNRSGEQSLEITRHILNKKKKDFRIVIAAWQHIKVPTALNLR